MRCGSALGPHANGDESRGLVLCAVPSLMVADRPDEWADCNANCQHHHRDEREEDGHGDLLGYGRAVRARAPRARGAYPLCGRHV